jgi:hypothetical protein
VEGFVPEGRKLGPKAGLWKPRKRRNERKGECTTVISATRFVLYCPLPTAQLPNCPLPTAHYSLVPRRGMRQLFLAGRKKESPRRQGRQEVTGPLRRMSRPVADRSRRWCCGSSATDLPVDREPDARAREMRCFRSRLRVGLPECRIGCIKCRVADCCAFVARAPPTYSSVKVLRQNPWAEPTLRRGDDANTRRRAAGHIDARRHEPLRQPAEIDLPRINCLW